MTGKPGQLQSMGSQSHQTHLSNRTTDDQELNKQSFKISKFKDNVFIYIYTQSVYFDYIIEEIRKKKQDCTQGKVSNAVHTGHD